MKTIKDINIENKKVIIRCDFNVPIKEGKIVDDTRIVSSLQTIKYCLEKNAKIILLSHLGRVKEESDLKKNDLAPVAIRLSELLEQEVKFIPTTRGTELENAILNYSQDNYNNNIKSFFNLIGSYEKGKSCNEIMNIILENSR